MAALSVFFRPFPWEADSAQVLIASAEGTAILGLVIASWRRIGAGLRRIREPYILMSVIFLLGFLYAFSQFGNFGILARQRVQALPFLLIFLAMPLGKSVAAAVKSANPSSTARSTSDGLA
jgi:hypothetical protein